MDLKEKYQEEAEELALLYYDTEFDKLSNDIQCALFNEASAIVYDNYVSRAESLGDQGR